MAIPLAPRIYVCPEHAKSLNVEHVDEPKVARNEDIEFRSFVQYVCTVFEINELTHLMATQVKRYVSELHMKYGGMKATVEYCMCFLEPPLSPTLKYGLGFIPKYYDEAKAFYMSRRRARQHARNVDMDTVVNQTCTITINESNLNQPTKGKLIDIGEMEVDDD